MIINILLNGPWHSWIELALYPPDKIWLLFMTDNLSRGKNVKNLFVRWIRNCWLNRKIRLIFCMIYRKASTKKRVFHLWVVKCRAISKHITLLLKRNTFLWTINPLDGSICVYTIHVRFRKVVYWFCLCSPFCVQKWKKITQKPHKDFHFYCSKTIPVSCKLLHKSTADWFLNTAVLIQLGISAILCGSLCLRTEKSLMTEKNTNRGKLNSYESTLKYIFVVFTGLVPEQKIKRAPTEATHEHGSRPLFRWVEKDARIPHEPLTGRTRRAWLPLLCKW